MDGTVTTIRSAVCEVDSGGQIYVCQARRRLVDSDSGESKPLAVGDRVLFDITGQDRGVVRKVLPRRTKLSRRSPRGRHTEHVIVTNVDQLLVVASVRKPPLTLGIIDRYVIAGDAGGIQPVICINKIDLARSESEYAGPAQLYEDMGYTVLLTSATERVGIELLAQTLRGKSTVLAGHSGVGKSSLINAVQPGLQLKTAAVVAKGRHTTSSVSLLKLDIGGYVVDTPGIREFTLWEIKKREVAQFFPLIWELSHDCRMPDCVHMHEPDCAVKAALVAGTLLPIRYESYVRIVESTEELTVPRATDVERPEVQIPRKKRQRGRSARKQDLLRQYHREADLDEDEDFD